MTNLTENIKTKGLQKTEIAESLGISRPTLDRYIENFEMGAYEKVPGAVLEFFRAVVSEDIDGKQAMESARALTSELKHVRDEIEKIEVQLERTAEEAMRLGELFNSNQLSSEEKDSVLKQQEHIIAVNNELNRKRMELIEKQSSLQQELRKITRIQTRDTVLSGPSWIKGNVDTMWTSFQGRIMILFRSAPETRTYVDIFTMIDNEEVLVGRFRPEEGTNYVTISDLLPKLSYSYRVTQLDDEGKKVSDAIEIRNR